MTKLIFLGTASAVSYAGHENSFLVLQGTHSAILIDCAARPLRQMKAAGIDFQDLSDLIITHFHADHVSGLANLIMDMWILGRQRELHIHGSQHSISRARKMMDLFEWDTWTGLYPVYFHEVPMEEGKAVLENKDFRILSSPVEHMIPTLGLRIEDLEGGFVLAYSADTNPVEQTVRLAAGADVLIHEAAGKADGHSTPEEAGEVAARAGVQALYLTHYPLRGDSTPESLLASAKTTFPGKVVVAEDLLEIEFKRD